MTLWNYEEEKNERRKQRQQILKVVSMKEVDMVETEKRWKYFRPEEVAGLAEDLVYKLDRAREFYGHPIVITSGYRDPNKNDLVGGVKGSEHTTGQGCDVAAPVDPELREKLAWAIGSAGFRRIGSYSKHFHVGISIEHPNPVFWVGDYK